MLACITAALWFWWDRNHGDAFLAALVLVTLAVLVRGKARPPRLWLWLTGLLLAVDLLAALAPWESLKVSAFLLRKSIS